MKRWEAQRTESFFKLGKRKTKQVYLGRFENEIAAALASDKGYRQICRRNKMQINPRCLNFPHASEVAKMTPKQSMLPNTFFNKKRNIWGSELKRKGFRTIKTTGKTDLESFEKLKRILKKEKIPWTFCNNYNSKRNIILHT